MSTIRNIVFAASTVLAGGLLAATISQPAMAGAGAGQTPVGVSEPGIPDARAFGGAAPERPRAAEPAETETAPRQRRKAPWEDCKPGGFWMMEGVDHSTTMMCK
jgi:hypothetical protein